MNESVGKTVAHNDCRTLWKDRMYQRIRKPKRGGKNIGFGSSFTLMIPFIPVTQRFDRCKSPRTRDALLEILSNLVDAINSHRHDFCTSKVTLQLFNSYPTRMKGFMKFNIAFLNLGGIQNLKTISLGKQEAHNFPSHQLFNIHHFQPTLIP